MSTEEMQKMKEYSLRAESAQLKLVIRDLLETMEQFAKHRFDSHASPEAIGAQIRNTARLAIKKAEDSK